MTNSIHAFCKKKNRYESSEFLPAEYGFPAKICTLRGNLGGEHMSGLQSKGEESGRAAARNLSDAVSFLWSGGGYHSFLKVHGELKDAISWIPTV